MKNVANKIVQISLNSLSYMYIGLQFLTKCYADIGDILNAFSTGSG